MLVAGLQSRNRDTTGKALEDAISRQAATVPTTPGASLSAPPAASNFTMTSAGSLSNAPAATTNALPK